MTEAGTTLGPAPTVDELVARATALRPLLEANAEETERQRRVAEENIDAIRAAGLCRLFTPRRFGGYEVTVREMLMVIRELGIGCGSTAWAMSLINVCSWMTGLFPEQAQQEVWGEDPDRGWVAGSLSPIGKARKVDGGVVVEGRWAWASGSLHAQWGALGVTVVDDAGEILDFGLSLIPMSELSIEDTWFVAGMRGTGSNTIVADGVFVPDHRLLSYGGALHGVYPTEHKDEALYRSAFVPVTVLILLGSQLGLAAAALELVTEKAPTRDVMHTHLGRQSGSVGFQLQLAEAAITIEGAHLHAYRAADDIDRAAASGEHPDFLARARMRMDSSQSAKLCREAIDILASAHGASSFAEANKLQRLVRDVHVASRHAITGWAVNLEIYGKALLGVEPNITELI
jgi:3-hydroxy-9,10-secoandrosta-1,3,5(10)-triene-9,17-dione monooxygenase